MGAPGQIEHAWLSARRARHAASVPRYLASAALVLLLALGIRALAFPPTAAAPERPAAAGSDLPSEDFALQFARAYLSFDAARPGLRQRALAPYLGAGQLEADAGLSPARGSQRVEWAQVASNQPALAGGRVITVAVGVSSQVLPLYLAVTVEHPPRAPLRLIGYPALVGAPAIEPPAAPPQREAVEDPALLAVVRRALRNYLAGSAADLRADLVPEAEVTLPTRSLRLEELSEVLWLGEPGSAAVLATLRAADSSGTTYALTYELGVVHRERPYLEFIEVVPTAS